jgi:hypothetical protein
MPLLLPSGNEVECGTLTSNNGSLTVQQRQSDSAVKGKRVGLQCSELFIV